MFFRLCVDNSHLLSTGSECSSEDLYLDEDSLLNNIELNMAFSSLDSNLENVIGMSLFLLQCYIHC